MREHAGPDRIDLSRAGAGAAHAGPLAARAADPRGGAGQAGAERIENMLQIGFFTRRTMEQLDAEGAGQRAARPGAAAARAAAWPTPQVDALLDTDRALPRGAAPERCATSPSASSSSGTSTTWRSSAARALLEKSFYYLTEDEIRQHARGGRRAWRSASRTCSRCRKRRLKRGKLDLHTMLRRNAGHGGVPFELVFKQRKKDRPKLVILCDVSSSVANVSRFMLQFVYSLQECFTKIRCFVFVSELGEVTPLFQENDISERDREGARRRRRDQRLHALELRPRLPPLLAELSCPRSTARRRC